MTAPDASAAYDGVAAAWDSGPSRLYDGLARAIVALYPVDPVGHHVLDIGAGTGAVSRALLARSARPTAVDLAPDMVEHMQAGGITAVIGDMRALPFEDATFDGAVTAFAVSHVDDPIRALQEAGRVVRPGGIVVVAGFATAPVNASKEVVDAVAESFGFVRPDWYVRLKRDLEPLTGTEDALQECARTAGLGDVAVSECVVDTGVSDPRDIVSVRLGMAHLAPFVASLSAQRRNELVAAAVAVVARDPQPIRPAVLVMTGYVPAAKAA